MRRKQAFDALFDCYKKEGRELGIMELNKLYPREVAYLKKVSYGSDVRVLLSRMRKIYASRWHEIYDGSLNIVHEKSEMTSKPTLNPLERLRVATRK